MACLSPETFALAGRYGFHLLYGTVFGLAPDKAQERLRDYTDGLQAHGHDPSSRRRGTLMMVYVADSGEQARQEFAEPVMWYYRTIAKYIAPPQGQAPVPSYEMYTQTRDLAASVSWDDLLQRNDVICGNADYVVEELTKAQEIYGFTDLLCWTRMGGLDDRKVLRSMELMHTKVFPHIRPLEPRVLAA
jgi:alkanesulfonate monooxygenase SsuD/methylene tetrahydromethanopterin reductase-like flavin-dependent oxidoreductase (luciferase family)